MCVFPTNFHRILLIFLQGARLRSHLNIYFRNLRSKFPGHESGVGSSPTLIIRLLFAALIDAMAGEFPPWHAGVEKSGTY